MGASAFTGYRKPLEKVAVAPSFQVKTPHREIVDEILKPPSTHWQRPLDQEKADQLQQGIYETQKVKNERLNYELKLDKLYHDYLNIN